MGTMEVMLVGKVLDFLLRHGLLPKVLGSILTKRWPPNIDFPDSSSGDPLDSRVEYRHWLHVQVINRRVVKGKRRPTTLATGCYGYLELTDATGQMRPTPCAFVGDYEAGRVGDYEGWNPRKTINISPDERRNICCYLHEVGLADSAAA